MVTIGGKASFALAVFVFSVLYSKEVLSLEIGEYIMHETDSHIH